MLHDFLPDKSACEKAMLHTNGAKRRRVLKGEKLEVHGRGISTCLSTFVLKSQLKRNIFPELRHASCPPLKKVLLTAAKLG